MKRLLSRTALTGLALALVLTLGACDLTELNKNPNAPSDVEVPFLFTNAQTDVAARYWDDFALGRFTIYYAQYWSPTTYTSESRYQFPIGRAGANSAIFSDYYFALNDLEEVIRISKTSPDEVRFFGDPQDIIAMANIMQVWTWQTLSDIYGALPFETALEGRDNPQPAYAGQEAIYMSLIDSLTAAASQLSGGRALAGADILFSGNTTLWKAFANGLKMRLAIRMAEAAPSAAQAAFVAAFNATSFTDIEGNQNALLPFAESQPYVNPLYTNTVISGRTDWAVSRTLLSLMNANEDPRRDPFAQLSQNGDYTGLPYGLPSGSLSAFPIFSLPSIRVAYTATAPAILYTESEELFMLAEAAERGWISGDPAQFYREAIAASMDYWDVPADVAAAYIASVPYDNSNGWAPPGDQATWYQTLGVQKWIAFYMQGLQGWSVFRRLDFDNVFVLPPGNPGVSTFGDRFPFRLPYPTQEPSLNRNNWNQAVETYYGGVDNQGQPLWWDDNVLGEPKKVAGCVSNEIPCPEG